MSTTSSDSSADGRNGNNRKVAARAKGPIGRKNDVNTKGPDRPLSQDRQLHWIEKAQDHMNLGHQLLGQQRHLEARKEYAASLLIRQKLLGTDHPDTITSVEWITRASSPEKFQIQTEEEIKLREKPKETKDYSDDDSSSSDEDGRRGGRQKKNAIRGTSRMVLDHDGMCIVLLERAQRELNIGHGHYIKTHFERALVEYNKSLVLRESLRGRYHFDTANAYEWICASYYLLKQYERAISCFRVWIKICRNETKDFGNPPMDNRMRKALQQEGLDEEEVQLYDANINRSLLLERRGDAFRSRKEYKRAIANYEEAIDCEDDCGIGNDISLAYLYRKIALVRGRDEGFSRKKTTTFEHKPQLQEHRWTDLDRIHPAWDRQWNATKYGILESVFVIVEEGDLYYVKGQHDEAIEKYQEAIEVGVEAEKQAAAKRKRLQEERAKNENSGWSKPF